MTITKDQTLYARWTVNKPSATKVTVKITSYNSVRISWKKVSKAKGYTVYRAASKNGNYKKIKTVKSNVLSIKDTGLKSGKTYYYKVAAYKTADKKHIYGKQSPAVGKQILGKPATPVQNKIAINVTDKTFTISWKPISKAQKVIILRKVDNGNYKPWKTVAAKKGSAAYSYEKYLAKSHQYAFKLRAYYVADGVKIYSGDSNGYVVQR